MSDLIDYRGDIVAAAIPPGGRHYRVVLAEADAAQLADLAGIIAAHDVSATLSVKPDGKDGLSVEGTIRARVTQTCVVTGEDFDSDVEMPIDISYAPDGVDRDEIDDEHILEDDRPDKLVNGRVCVAEVIDEFFLLGLDLYPVKPGVTRGDADMDGQAEDKPFDVLRSLLSRR